MAKLVVIRDPGLPLAELLAALPEAERRQAAALAPARRQRQFCLGRLAARWALAGAQGDRPDAAPFVVLTDRRGAPVPVPALTLTMTGRRERCRLAVSVSHSGSLAAACAWHRGQGRAFGLDLERVRPTEIAASPLAFAPAERAAMAALPEAVAGLVAWALKEAAWKAYRLPPERGPEAVALLAACPRRRQARLAVALGRRRWPARATWRELAGPDGRYVLALATGARRPPRRLP